MDNNNFQIVLTVFSGIIAVVASYMGYKFQKRDERRDREHLEEDEIRKKESDAIREGMQIILRDRIMDLYNHCVKINNAPFYAIENMIHMYNAYHNLGGNGGVSEIYRKFQELPHRTMDPLEIPPNVDPPPSPPQS